MKVEFSNLPTNSARALNETEPEAISNSAFNDVVNYYHGGVYNLVYAILCDADDAADVTKDVFLRAFRESCGFRQSISLKTWIYRVAVQQALKRRRWLRRRRCQQPMIDAEVEGSRNALESQNEEATFFEQLPTRQVQASASRALSAVPIRFRSAVILKDIEGLSYEEAAEVLEVSVRTVKSRIWRGRRMLKEILYPRVRPRESEKTELIGQIESPPPYLALARMFVLRLVRGSRPAVPS